MLLRISYTKILLINNQIRIDDDNSPSLAGANDAAAAAARCGSAPEDCVDLTLRDCDDVDTPTSTSGATLGVRGIYHGTSLRPRNTTATPQKRSRPDENTTKVVTPSKSTTPRLGCPQNIKDDDNDNSSCQFSKNSGQEVAPQNYKYDDDDSSCRFSKNSDEEAVLRNEGSNSGKAKHEQVIALPADLIHQNSSKNYKYDDDDSSSRFSKISEVDKHPGGLGVPLE